MIVLKPEIVKPSIVAEMGLGLGGLPVTGGDRVILGPWDFSGSRETCGRGFKAMTEPKSSSTRGPRSGLLTAILLLFVALFLGLEVYAIGTGSRYQWDFIFVLLLWCGVYGIRHWLDLRAIPFALLGCCLGLHLAGMFGWYQTYPFGLEYDHWVHGLFGLVAMLMVLQAYHLQRLYSPWMINLAGLVLILGFSAFHEIFEYAGAMLLGQGEGVLFVGAGDLDEWDTQKDMLNNLIGGLLGLGVFSLLGMARK